MGTQRGLTRLSADPGSFEPTHLVDPELLLSGEPNDRGVTMFTSDDGTVESGLWACDTYKERLPSYPVDELYVIIEGTLVVASDGQTPETFKAGDALVIRAGTSCVLDFQGPFRKFWMTYRPAPGAGSA